MGFCGWRVVRISGQSMEPEIRAGAYGVFRRTGRVDKNDTVLVDHPRLGLIVKAVLRVDEGGIWLCGRNDASTSSIALGAVPRNAVLGKLVFKVSPP